MLYAVKIFDIYLFTQINKEKNEFIIPKKIKRLSVKGRSTVNFIKQIEKKRINILIYQFPINNENKILNEVKKFKIIFCQHYSIFFWIYRDFEKFKMIYKAYQNSAYIVSFVSFENDYLFEKWGIRSIFMNNFITFDYNNITPSNLSSNIILMIGRGNDKLKRFELGIKSMKMIVNRIPNSEMKIISDDNNLNNLKLLVKDLNLLDNIKFVGYTLKPEIFFQNASLHIFPTLTETFGLVLSETKIFGIPTILVGLDYVSISKGGTIIIYDDSPNSIAKEAVKILLNKKYRIKLGNEARKSMMKFNNELLLNKWIKLILSIYNGDSYFIELRKKEKKISINLAKKIIKNQIKLLKMRKKKYKKINIHNFNNFTFLEQLNI